MNVYNLNYSVNDIKKSFDVKSNSFKRGGNFIVFKKTIKNQEILNSGFTIKQLPFDFFVKIKQSVTNIILKSLNIQKIYPEKFDIEKYHEYVNDEQHIKIINDIRGGILGLGGVHLDRLGVSVLEIDNFINDIIIPNNKLSCIYNFYGLKIKHFWVRIVRPNKTDNNAPHKDTHIKRLNSPEIMNIYLPLAGSNENSSLPIIPESHLENENEYIISQTPCFIDNRRFTAPALVHRNKGLNLITPNPNYGEVMIFTPSTVHGGGFNGNTDKTRISVEMRFFS
jgi:hypothetical protein